MRDRPRLKAITVQSLDGQLVLWPRALQRVFVDDPSGAIAALLRILSSGQCEIAQLRPAMASRGYLVTDEEVSSALEFLNDLGVLEEVDGDETLDPATLERHESNLRFYDLFSRIGRSSASFHRSAQRSRVLLLGVGGLGSGILQSLVGLGVGEVTIVDIDTVEKKNLARQFIYGPGAIGAPKVTAARDWARSYSPGTRVRAVRERITDAASIVDLGQAATGRPAADIVVCAIDSPDDIHLIVNKACCTLGIRSGRAAHHLVLRGIRCVGHPEDRERFDKRADLKRTLESGWRGRLDRADHHGRVGRLRSRRPGPHPGPDRPPGRTRGRPTANWQLTSIPGAVIQLRLGPETQGWRT